MEAYSLKKILQDCKKISIAAGKSIMEIYERNKDFQVFSKQDNSPLTEADKLSNTIIVDKLRENYREYSILSEEEKDDQTRLENDYCFVVDPLDGTKEFLKRNGQFTVNIGLAYKHEVILGVIYVPCSQELYYASKGSGAFLQKRNGEIIRLQVSDKIGVNEIRIVKSRSHDCEEMINLLKKYSFREQISIGSSLKGCLIARGEAELYYRYNPTMEWDTAAMQCIVEEAGGIFRQMDGSIMRYNRENCLNEKGFFIVNRVENIVK